MNTENIQHTCETCGKAFHSKESFVYDCPPCGEKHRKESEADQRERDQQAMDKAKLEAQQLVNKITPPRFASTNTSDPRFNLALWRKVQNWKPTDDVPWLGLVGESGACKTRVALLLFHKLIVENIQPPNYGHEIHGNPRIPTHAFITSGDFHDAVMAQFQKNGSEQRRDYRIQSPTVDRTNVKDVRTCDILLIDDLGKGRPTPAITEELFRLIDHRHAHCLTTIWTANSTPEQIAANFPPEIAGPLAGRLIECSFMPKV